MKLKGKKVLVTGADGFIGSHLCELLLEKGCNLRALSQYNSFNSWGWLEDIDRLSEIEVVSGDIRDNYFIKKITEGIDVIFHLAALIAIPFSYLAPQSYIDTNITGTLNICQAALGNNCMKVVHTSTSEVYGTADYVPIDEGHPLKPQSPYSASKIGADSIAWSFYRSFELPVSIARPFNAFGPRQSARAIIPTIITQLLKGEKQLILGDLSPTRDLNFVKDTCLGLIAVAESDETSGEFLNIGSGREISIGALVDLIQEKMGTKAEIVQAKDRIRPKGSEVYRLCCDNTKLKKLTGFSPKTGLEEGIKITANWFSNPANLENYKTEIYNL
ncbi:MAG: NAD-dependent 4,6-dehydratase LegB [Desulforegulaceae bacterium]|nr:NAD-dependent 4,6-dehydratase LegB [Desulforegulaceae bacterium]